MGEPDWLAPEPFLRGTVHQGVEGVAYPRLDPADAGRLPADTWYSSTIPVGVRLEVAGDATHLAIRYRTGTDDFGYRGMGAGTNFSLWHGNLLVEEVRANLGDGEATLSLPDLPANIDRHVITIPEGMRPSILKIAAIGGQLVSPPTQPRWLSYGDSIAEGWVSTGPGRAWPAVIGRTLGLNVVNLGFAGAARAEIVVAQQMAAQPASLISIAVGTNCYERIPHSIEQMSANLHAFLDVLRSAHPLTPILVISPLLRPDAEARPNLLGATLQDLRAQIEGTTRERLTKDTHLHLLEGRDLVGPERLPDAIHPDDEGHRIVASIVARNLDELIGASQSHGRTHRTPPIG